MKKVINYFVFFTIGTMFFIHNSNSAVFYPKDENPMFSNHENQISGYFGMGSKTWYFETSLFSTFWRYSQPDKFLRLPGRLSFETGGMFGFKDKNRNIDYSQYNQALFGFTQDVLIFYTKNYFCLLILLLCLNTRKTQLSNLIFPQKINYSFLVKNKCVDPNRVIIFIGSLFYEDTIAFTANFRHQKILIRKKYMNVCIKL